MDRDITDYDKILADYQLALVVHSEEIKTYDAKICALALVICEQIEVMGLLGVAIAVYDNPHTNTYTVSRVNVPGMIWRYEIVYNCISVLKCPGGYVGIAGMCSYCVKILAQHLQGLQSKAG